MVTPPPVVEEFGRELGALGWVSGLLVAGSLATGDYLPGVSDLDLVALVDGPVDAARQATLTDLHRRLDAGTGSDLHLGCVYVEIALALDVFPPMSPDDVRAVARAELTGYWAWAARRPWLWWDPVIADLGLTSMARGRHALGTGELLTKTEAIRQAAAPAWLIDQLAARRRGASPRPGYAPP